MKIEVRNAPSELCRKVFTAAAGELRRFRPNQFYTDSTDAIAQLHGYVNFEEFKRGHDFRRAAIKEFLAQGAKGNDRLALLQALIDSHLFSPLNYKIYQQNLVPVETARRIIFQDIQPTGIQLASNYGVYPLFLKEQAGLSRFFGIDIDKAAVAYAQTIGAPVIEADTRQLPFFPHSLDLVISSHFLDSSYFGLVLAVKNNNWGEDFIKMRLAVMSEVYRVLRPGGWFVTQTEVTSLNDLICSWPGTIAQIMTFDFGPIKFDNLFAVQKG